MPTYHARGITARLGAIPLADVVTPNIVLGKGGVAKDQCETAEAKLLGSNRLTEEPVEFPGDEAHLQLNWLANTPFMQAQAGAGFFDGEHSEHDCHNHRKPQALVLRIDLTEKTFISGLDNKKTSLKIEVLFNGQLASCVFVPRHNVRTAVEPLHQIFAGTRIDYLAERPWIIVPPGVAADGNVQATNKKIVSVHQRWLQMCQALQHEASERGSNEEGAVPPTAKFLGALASMQMPDKVRDMQPLGGSQFGVIDVVVTAGEGRKLISGASYLKAPQRFADERFSVAQRREGTAKLSQAANVGRSDTEPHTLYHVEPMPGTTDRDAEDVSDSEYGPPSKRRALMSHVLPIYGSSFASASSTPTNDLMMPSMPLPTLSTSTKFSTNVGSRTQSGLPPAVAVAEGRINNTFSLEHGPNHAYIPDDGPYNEPNQQVYAGPGLARSLYLSPPPTTSSTLISPMRMPLYDMHFSDPVQAPSYSNDPIHSVVTSDVGLQSSPLPQVYPSFRNGIPHDLSPLSSQTPEILKARLEYGPPSAHLPWSAKKYQASMAPPFQYPSFSALPTNYHFPAIGIESSGAPSLMSGMPPALMRSFGGFNLTSPNGQQINPPYDSQLSAPLPPAGLYTVPTKPKRSSSSRNAVNDADGTKHYRSIVVNRLIITGHNGTILVDHSWTFAHPVLTGYKDRTASVGLSNSPTDQVPDSGGIVTSAGPSSSKRSTAQSHATSHTNPVGLHDHVPSLYTNKSYTDSFFATETMQGFQVDSLDEPVLVPRAHSLRLASESDVVAGNNEPSSTMSLSLPTIPTTQRRTISSRIPGIQGPKATPFWLEDPEELLRGAARSRRSKSPMKRTSLPVDAPRSAPAVPLVNEAETDASSPLSSVPTTPDTEIQALNRTHEDEKPVTKFTASINDIDKSCEREIAPSTSRVPQTPSLTKLVPNTTSRLKAPTQSRLTSHFSISPNTKKRKAISRTLTKQPRSPDRLKTISNPPLNQDCVIAYAETKDKESDKGILRQVRSERQGVFQEDYVVFAARFYVAGT